MYTRVKKKKKRLGFFHMQKKNKKNNNNGNKVKTKNLHALFAGNERRDASKTAMKTQRNTGVNNKIKIKQIEREGGVSFVFFFFLELVVQTCLVPEEIVATRKTVTQ